jgi:hypothetical protein
MSNNQSPLFLDNEIAQTVRRRELRERSKEEHEWVSIDCKLRPEIYDAGFKPLFNLCLNQDELHRLLKVPKKLQHALGFVKNNRELKAHSLLHKFYRVKNEDEENIWCCESNEAIEEDLGLADIASIGKRLATRQDLNELVEDESIKLSKDFGLEDKGIFRGGCVVCDWNQLENLYSPISIHNSYVVMKESVRILERASCIIGAKERHNYSFAIQNDHSRKLAALTISIIFQGTFVGDEYEPGYLSASLCSIGKNQERASVGDANHSLQALNCNKNLGRLVIEHEPGFEVDYVEFEVIIVGFSQCRYSIAVSGKVMVPIKDYFVNELHILFLNQQKVSRYHQNIDDINLDIRIMHRKVSLLQHLCDNMEQNRLEVKNAIDAAEYKLENDDLAIGLNSGSSEGERVSYFEQRKLIKVRSEPIFMHNDNSPYLTPHLGSRKKLCPVL